MKKFTLDPEPHFVEESGSGPSHRRLAVYDTHEALNGDPFSIEATYSDHHIYGVVSPPVLHVSRFITGASLYILSFSFL